MEHRSKKSYRILLVSRWYYPDVIGGGEVSAHYLARSLVGAGATVRVLTFVTDGLRKVEVIDGVPIARLPIRALKLFPRLSNLEWMYYQMARQTHAFLNEFKPDILHATNQGSVPGLAAVSRRTGIPFVATVNSPDNFCFVGSGTDRRGGNCFGCRGMKRFQEIMHRLGRGRILNAVMAFPYWLYSIPHMGHLGRCHHQASMLLPVSRGLRTELLRLGFPEEKIRVVHNPIEVHARLPSTRKAELGIPEQAPVLMYAGRLSESKGVQNVIDTLPRLENVYFVVVGRGRYEPELRKRAMQRGVNSRVRFVGFVPHSDIGTYYSIADVVIMAGTFYESLGRMLMEACAYGVPVIGADRGGNPEVIEDGKNGFLLRTQSLEELEEKIRAILSSPALAHSMGVFGQIKMRHEFSLERAAKRLIDAYGRAVELQKQIH